MKKDEQILFDELKAKGIEPPDMDIEVPEHLEAIESTSKPLVLLNLSDRWNQFTNWLGGALTKSIGKILGIAIPLWFWVALILAFGIVLYMKL